MFPDLLPPDASPVLLAADNTLEIEMDVFKVKIPDNSLKQIWVRKKDLLTMPLQVVKDELYSSAYLKVPEAKTKLTTIASARKAMKYSNLRFSSFSFRDTIQQKVNLLFRKQNK